MGRLRIFVVQEPVVAASCLIAGFGTLSSPVTASARILQPLLSSVCKYAYTCGDLTSRMQVALVFLYHSILFLPRCLSFDELGMLLVIMRSRNAGFTLVA